MTVAYAYFKYLIDRENHKCLVYYFPGAADVQFITEQTPVCGEMGIGGKQSKDPAVVAVEASAEVGVVEVDLPAKEAEKSKLRAFTKMKSSQCCTLCSKILFVLLGILAILLAISTITITVLTSIATKAYDTEQSSRLVAMVLLAVTAAIATCIIIYAEVAVFKEQLKPIHAAAIVLLVLAVIQGLIAGISVKVTDSDEMRLGKSLAESFKLSKEDHPRHVRLWATTQNDLNCCGVYGPEDYRSPQLPYYFSPNIPISCCPTYDSSRSELVQERERESCKARKSYYDIGCKDLVLVVFKETSSMVLGVTVALIITELLLMILGAMICKRAKLKANNKPIEPEK